MASMARLVDVVEQLLADADTAAGPDRTRRVLAALMTAIDAVSVRLVTEDDEVLADWRRPTLPLRRRHLQTLTAPLPDGSRLTATWSGDPSMTQQEFAAVAGLLGLVEERHGADRHAAQRLRQQRRAWGQEIHDGVTQSVTAAVMMLERIKTVSDDPNIHPLVDQAQAEIRGSLRDVRDILAQVVADDVDEGQTLPELIDDVRNRWRLQAKVTTRGELTGLSGEVAAIARGVIRESLINVAKHTTASRVAVSVHHELETVRVEITDDGEGISVDTQGPSSPLQMGLRLMSQRVELVSGSLAVESAPGRGTTVRAVLPRATTASS